MIHKKIMKFNIPNQNNAHSKPIVNNRQAQHTDTSDSEDLLKAGESDEEEEEEEEEEGVTSASAGFKASRSRAIRLNLNDVRDDKGNMKLVIVDTIYHAKAHLKKGMIKACGKIVEEWGVNVPQEFVPFNLNGNKLYNSYSKVMASVATALRENGGTINFGVTKTGASAEPEYFRVARKIIAEAMANEAKKQAALQQKQALSARMDANATSHISAAMQGKSKRKFNEMIENPGIHNVSSESTSSSTHIKKEKPVDPFTNLLNLQTRALELKVKKREKEAAAIDLTHEDDDQQEKKRQKQSIVPGQQSFPQAANMSDFEDNEVELELEPDVLTSAHFGRSSSSSATPTTRFSRFATQADLLEVRDYLDNQLRVFAEVRDKQHAELMEIFATNVQSREAVMVTPREGTITEPMDIVHMKPMVMAPFSPPVAPTKPARITGKKKKEEDLKEDKEVEK